ncbi:MAG: hypothetical protein ILA52_00120 [Alphaproteobacteria bacterium]|nr:hypothetical protein [Alphaproteobacteria bacterium]
MPLRANSNTVQPKVQGLHKGTLRPKTAVDTAIEIPLLPHYKAVKQKQLDIKLDNALQTVRNCFKTYITKAKYHINSGLLRKNALNLLIDKHYNNDENLQILAGYLAIALINFKKNVKKFQKNIENTECKLCTEIKGSKNTDVKIHFMNKKGKKIGPFLQTHIVVSPITRYDMLAISIGYMDKHKKPVVTHYFGYDVLENIGEYMERRGMQAYFKTNKQINERKELPWRIKEKKEKLQEKYEI